jgi:murein L,D-transpeptidase YafK
MSNSGMYRFAVAGLCTLIYSCAETGTMQSRSPSVINDTPRPARPISSNDELPQMTLPRLIITKKDRKLEVFDGDKLVKTFRISLGFAPIGAKETEGDGKTPEGEFYIYTKNEKSAFYLSLGVSYPSVKDAERGLSEGLISQAEHDEIVDAVLKRKMPPQKTQLGGEIYLHGGGTGKDWTYGCAALADEDIRELFNAIPIGTPIGILP